jgi:hypothetical protein
MFIVIATALLITGAILVATLSTAHSRSDAAPTAVASQTTGATTAPTSAETTLASNFYATVETMSSSPVSPDVMVYDTTRAAAAQAVGAGTVGFQPTDSVTVLVFSGTFVDDDASYPAGALPPHGSSITYVIDNSTNKMTDFSIGPPPSQSELSELGTPAEVVVPTTN